MRKSWSSKPPIGGEYVHNSAFPMHARRVMVKNTRTPKKGMAKAPIPKSPTTTPSLNAQSNSTIAIAYAKCLEMMITEPMAEESEPWREAIIRAKPARMTFETPRPMKSCLKNGRNNENRKANFIGNVEEGDTFFG